MAPGAAAGGGVQGDLLGAAIDGRQAARAAERAGEASASSSSPAGGELVPGGRSGPGRPKGSRNRSTAQMVRYLNSFGQGPLVGLARIVNMVDAAGLPDLPAIARHCGMERAEAAEFWLRCARDASAPQIFFAFFANSVFTVSAPVTILFAASIVMQMKGQCRCTHSLAHYPT